MKNVLYLIQAISIYFFFFVCKIIGYKNSSNLGAFLGKKLVRSLDQRKYYKVILKKLFLIFQKKK